MVHVMKGRGFRKVVALCLVAFLLTGSMVQISPVSVQATTIEDEKDKIDGLQGEKEELESQVAKIDEKISAEQEKQDEYLKKMTAAREQIEQYQGQIDDVNVEISELNDKIEELNGQIDEANQEIKKKEKEIAQKEAEIEEANEKFKARLSAMYMASGDLTIMSVLLGAESFSDFLTQSQVLQNISDNDNQLMDELAAYKAELEGLKTELEDFKKELETTKEDVESTKQEVEDKRQEIVSLQNQEQIKENEMSDLRAESVKIVEQNEAAQSANADEIAEIEAAIAEAESNIAYLIQQAEEERQQQENNSNNGGGEEGGGGDDTPDVPSSSGWTHPCPGYSYVSSYFGPREQPLPGASTNHGAVDFAAGSGTSIYASRSGTVVDAIWGWGGGYGNHILISHGDGYYTLYAHCSSLNVSAGQTVSQGQVIGYVGSTGNSTGPHLHFEVRKGSTKVDPFDYL